MIIPHLTGYPLVALRSDISISTANAGLPKDVPEVLELCSKGRSNLKRRHRTHAPDSVYTVLGVLFFLPPENLCAKNNADGIPPTK